MMQIRLPWPPSTNELHTPIPSRTGRSRLISSRRAREFRTQCMEIIEQAGGPRQVHGTVAVHMSLHPSTMRPYDLDNRVKAVLDALTKSGVLFDDDWKIIAELHVKAGRKATREERDQMCNRGFVDVTLEAIQ